MKKKQPCPIKFQAHDYKVVWEIDFDYDAKYIRGKTKKSSKAETLRWRKAREKCYRVYHNNTCASLGEAVKIANKLAVLPEVKRITVFSHMKEVTE